MSWQRLTEVKKKLSGSKYSEITTVVDDEDVLDVGFEIVKERLSLALKRYPKSMVYSALIDGELWQKYAGLTKEQSKRINEILVDSILEGKYLYPRVVAQKISREIGLPMNRALIIARTELAYTANKAREFAYKEMTNVEKFVWVAEPDACEKCKRVQELSSKGVTLEELKRIIRRVCGGTARELLCHPNCRCSIKRFYDDKRYKRWWE